MNHSKQPGSVTLGTLSSEPDNWSVVWSRGEGCKDLAELLAQGAPRFAGGDPRGTCIAARADFIVQRHLTSFDLVNVAVPYHFHPRTHGSVAVAVAGGLHSELSARVARRIAEVRGTRATLICVSRSRADDPAAQQVLDRIANQVPGLTPVLMRARSATSLLASIEPDTLLVIGAPGGTWLQRQLFGPGRQLIRVAPGGAIVVRSTQPRCFQRAGPAVIVSPWLHVEDARRVVDEAAAAVVDAGLLVGIVRRDALQTAADGAEVASVTEEPVFVKVDDPLEAVADLRSFLEGAPVPVIDTSGRYLGSVAT